MGAEGPTTEIHGRAELRTEPRSLKPVHLAKWFSKLAEEDLSQDARQFHEANWKERGRGLRCFERLCWLGVVLPRLEPPLAIATVRYGRPAVLGLRIHRLGGASLQRQLSSGCPS